MFEAVSTISDWTGTKLMTLPAPEIPLVPTAPEVLYCRMLSCEMPEASAWGAFQAIRPRAMTAVRSPVHPLVMCILSS